MQGACMSASHGLHLWVSKLKYHARMPPGMVTLLQYMNDIFPSACNQRSCNCCVRLSNNTRVVSSLFYEQLATDKIGC